MKCIICGKDVPVLESFVPNPAGNCWDGGIVEWIQAGYGSRHDTAKFLICICDDCIEKVASCKHNFQPPPYTEEVEAYLKRLRYKPCDVSCDDSCDACGGT
jgi:hypothetical protein